MGLTEQEEQPSAVRTLVPEQRDRTAPNRTAPNRTPQERARRRELGPSRGPLLGALGTALVMAVVAPGHGAQGLVIAVALVLPWLMLAVLERGVVAGATVDARDVGGGR